MVSSQRRVFEDIADHIKLNEHALATDLLAIANRHEQESQALARKHEQEKTDLQERHEHQLENYRKSLRP